MTRAVAIVCAALPIWSTACTIGPAAPGGGTSTSTGAPRTLGDQCQEVISAFCQLLPGCAVEVALDACISNYMPLCCTGDQCTETSTISEATVTSCDQANEALDCNAVVNTANPSACLSSQ